jgi:hypothetical protein
VVGLVDEAWIPAFAGMARIAVDFQSTHLEPLGVEPRAVEYPRRRDA